MHMIVTWLFYIFVNRVQWLQQVLYSGLCVMDLVSKLGRVNLKLCLGIAGVQLIGYALYKAIKTAVFSKLLKVSFKKWEYWPVLWWWLAISNYCFLKVWNLLVILDFIKLIKSDIKCCRHSKYWVNALDEDIFSCEAQTFVLVGEHKIKAATQPYIQVHI